MSIIVNLLILLFLFFLCTQVLKFSLYVFYLWQIVEYRIDRFMARITNRGDRNEFLGYANLVNLYPSNKYPKPTARIFFSFLLYLFIIYQTIFIAYRPIVRLLNFQENLLVAFFLVIFIVYYATPLVISIINVFMNLLLVPFKKIVIAVALRKRQSLKKLTVIGVTGSYGKSSTKEIIAEILSLKYRVAKTPENNNTILGVAKTILLRLNSDHELFVVEMGAYKKGEIKEICDLALPQVGVLTGINEQHLVLFGNINKTAQAKYELVESLPSTGLAFFNGKDARCLKLWKKTKNCKALVYGEDSSEFEEAIGAGMAVGLHFGIEPEKINKIIPKLKKNLGISTYYTKSGLKIFDDSYSSNPRGFVKALNTINKIKRKKIVVTPGIIELGSQSKIIHERLARKLTSVADKVILTNSNFSENFENIAGDKFKDKYLVSSDADLIALWLGKYPSSDWLVLLEGRIPSNVKNYFLKK